MRDAMILYADRHQKNSETSAFANTVDRNPGHGELHRNEVHFPVTESPVMSETGYIPGSFFFNDFK